MDRAAEVTAIIHDLRLIFDALTGLVVLFIAFEGYRFQLLFKLLREQRDDRSETKEATQKALENSERLDKLENDK